MHLIVVKDSAPNRRYRLKKFAAPKQAAKIDGWVKRQWHIPAKVMLAAMVKALPAGVKN